MQRFVLRFFILLVLIISFGCNRKETKNHAVTYKIIVPDSSAYALDSLFVDRFFQKHPTLSVHRQNIKAFYSGRAYASAWVNKAGLNEYAGHFINLLNHEEILTPGDSVVFKNNLMLHYQKQAFSLRKIRNDSLVSELELLLSLNFFEYARRNWGGVNDETLEKVRWFIERKQLNYGEVMSSFLSKNAGSALSIPAYRQYELLKTQLGRYSELEKQNSWPELPEESSKLKPGDHSSLVPLIKKQLFLLGDLALNDTSDVFDTLLMEATIAFQARHGLQEDGIISGATYKELKITLRERIEQLLINLERSRWVPSNYEGDYLVVNIPEFKLHVYASDTLAWSCRAIVGKSDEPLFNTIIFNDSVEFIVFSPYWNIPKNILMKETLPALKKDRSYLKRNNLEVVTREGKPVNTFFMRWDQYTDHFPYIIREKPGKNNSLGLVKFLFPNPYDIYLHDTPAKELFKKNKRDFSHGCIRIEEPERLAQFLLRKEKDWTQEKITEYMTGGKETFIKLKKKVPVFIAYFTAWVDSEGQLNFRPDVYGHDEKMKSLLFVN